MAPANLSSTFVGKMQDSKELDLGYREGPGFFPDSWILDCIFYVAHPKELLSLLSGPAAE
jgi:hypothetical protein